MTEVSVASAAPPIITYPEFLLRNRQTSSVLTADNLTKLGSAVAVTSTVIYGTGKLYFEPMRNALLSTRRDLLNYTRDALHNFNDDLAALIPEDAMEHQASTSADAEQAAEAPACFHLDKATQTSRTVSRTQSSQSLANIAFTATPDSDLLSSLNGRLRDIADGDQDEQLNNAQVKIKGLDEYIRGLELPPRNPLRDPEVAHQAGQQSADLTTSYEQILKEIRQMKGCLLSTRSFPRAGA